MNYLAKYVMIAMREIQPDHVHAGAQDRLQHPGRIGGGAEGGDDAGVATLFLRGCGGHEGDDIAVSE